MNAHRESTSEFRCWLCGVLESSGGYVINVDVGDESVDMFPTCIVCMRIIERIERPDPGMEYSVAASAFALAYNAAVREWTDDYIRSLRPSEGLAPYLTPDCRPYHGRHEWCRRPSQCECRCHVHAGIKQRESA